MTRKYRHPWKKERNRGGREAADNGATGRLVKAFHLSTLMLVTLKNVNHMGEVKEVTGRRQILCRSALDPLKGPNKEVEIPRQVLKREKNLALSKNTCAEKE